MKQLDQNKTSNVKQTGENKIYDTKQLGLKSYHDNQISHSKDSIFPILKTVLSWLSQNINFP